MKETPKVFENLEKHKRMIYATWKDVDRDDIWMYFCILILMGIIKMPEIHIGQLTAFYQPQYFQG